MANVGFKLAQYQYLKLKDWLFEAALPLWSSVGTDHRNGGFFEKIDKSVVPIEAPRRTRVVCRQIYSFGAAGAMGWKGDARGAVEHGWTFLKSNCMNADGSVIANVDVLSGRRQTRFDLYDHAFALFGLCSSARALEGNHQEIEMLALKCLDAMYGGWKHPSAGFEEACPPIEPLRSNPHMHVFEAALAWSELARSENKGLWIALANDIGNLCLSRFLSPENGAIREYYYHNWTVSADEVGSPIEPGHQFEWAWLLARWGRLTGRKEALIAARRLVEIGETFGVAEDKGLVINGLNHDLSPHDCAFRLWPQTERIKAWLMMAELAMGPTDRNFAMEKVAKAAEGLIVFLSEIPAGLWRDRLSFDGLTIEEASPASSLYHIVCAIEEMHSFLHPRLPRPALFLDRDGVIIEDTGYVGGHDGIRLIDGIVETIRHFRDKGYYIFVVTNQSGVGRGYYDEDDYNLVRAKITNELKAQNVSVDDERASPYYIKSETPQYLRDGNWRKPNPGMILDIAAEWNVDKKNSLLIGDRPTDLEAASAADLRGVLFTGGNLFEFLKEQRLIP